MTGLLVGLAPAALHLRRRLAEATSSGGSRTTRGRGAKRIGNALVVGEVALASLLLVGAGLFVASFARLMRIDPGCDYRHVLALGITTPATAQCEPRGPGGCETARPGDESNRCDRPCVPCPASWVRKR